MPFPVVRATPVLRLATMALLVLGGLASAGEPESGWRELQTAHINLRTDLGSADARRAALRVERTRAALLAAGWPGAKLLQPERVEVVVFANGLEFEHHFGRQAVGVFLHGEYPPTAFLYGAPETWEHRETLALEETTSVLKHELVHHLAAYFFRRQPRWFAEGLAQFLETLRFSEDGKTATVGEINLQALKSYNRYRTLTVTDVLGWGGKTDAHDEATVAGLYGLSWLLVHWLYNTHLEDFARYETLLAKGIEPDKAWKVAFPSLVVATIDAELNHYAHHGDYHSFLAPIPDADSAIRERPMTAADVHATRARAALGGASVLAQSAPHQEEARAELAAALAADPGNVRALWTQISLVPEAERLPLAQRATAAHPDDGLAWLALGETLGQGPESRTARAAAYRKATELLPDHPQAFHALAVMDLQEGRPKEALPLAVAASRMAPWDSTILNTLAAALAEVGRCTEAVAAASRAVETLPEQSSAKTRAWYQRRLAEVSRQCVAATGVPPASAPGTAPTPAP
jgi:tetratricopeptide (TPR) repeat protein